MDDIKWSFICKSFSSVCVYKGYLSLFDQIFMVLWYVWFCKVTYLLDMINGEYFSFWFHRECHASCEVATTTSNIQSFHIWFKMSHQGLQRQSMYPRCWYSCIPSDINRWIQIRILFLSLWHKIHSVDLIHYFTHFRILKPFQIFVQIFSQLFLSTKWFIFFYNSDIILNFDWFFLTNEDLIKFSTFWVSLTNFCDSAIAILCVN